ncbi:MAG: ImmA/IrrE family metallo-endopeptidase [Acidobacteria bacterium]|nr:ImmA/IrrE family metallo-endopeptidase [Acidobacteriota bacterium]
MQTQATTNRFGERVRAARRLAGLSQRETANRVGVTAMAISKYETGKMIPSSGVLLRLAEALGVDVEFFLRPCAVRVEAPAFRRHPRLSERDRKRAEAAAAEWIERYLETEQLAGSKATASHLPRQRYRVTSPEDAEAASERLRKRWGLGEGPIASMIDLLEDHGVRVGVISLPEKVDAMVFRIDGGAPVMALRESIPGDRQRFSVAHDLGHLVISYGEEIEEEATCHRFAAAFLVPAPTARRELGTRRSELSLLELHHLKHKYGMSMAAWIKRARELGIVSDRYARRLLALFKKEGWDRCEPGSQVPAERPARMEQIVIRLVQEGTIGPGRASELLGRPWDEFVQERSEDSGDLPIVAGL